MYRVKGPYDSLPVIGRLMLSTNLLSDFRVVLLNDSVEQQAGRVHVDAWTFTAGAVVIWVTEEMDSWHVDNVGNI